MAIFANIVISKLANSSPQISLRIPVKTEAFSARIIVAIDDGKLLGAPRSQFHGKPNSAIIDSEELKGFSALEHSLN